MTKAESILQFYETTQKLKTVIRSGWKIWEVQAERLESVAEHIYGVQMLALAMYCEYGYDVNLQKVIMMLAVHELEEIYIGDLTPFDNVTPEEKRAKGRAAVVEILKPIAHNDTIMQLVLEFDEDNTPESRFAHQCDKLEAGLQARIYDRAGDFGNADRIMHNPITSDAEVRELVAKHSSLSKAWLEYWERRVGYDQNFAEVSRAAREY